MSPKGATREDLGTGKRRGEHTREHGALDLVSSSKLAGLRGGLPGSKSEHRNTIHSTYHLHKLNLYAARQNTHSARTYASNSFTGSRFEWLPKGAVTGPGLRKAEKRKPPREEREGLPWRSSGYESTSQCRGTQV